jgi:hypothetical protein
VIARRRSVLAALACTALATAAMAWLLASRGDELTAALDRLPLEVFALAAALHLTVLIVRAEAWGVTLAATRGRSVRQRDLHTACAGSYLAGTVEIHSALPVRMALMRRLAPEDAPGVREMVLSDMPLFWFEVLIACIAGLVAASAVPGVAWWVAPLALVAAVAVTLALRVAHERFAHHRLAGGLAVLGSRRLRLVLGVLSVGIALPTVLRVWLLAAACGIDVDAAEVALLYVAIGALGLLPIGPASVPGATVAVAGASAGVGAAGAAGLAIAASTIAAVIVYVSGAALYLAVGSVSRRVSAPPAPSAASSNSAHSSTD